LRKINAGTERKLTLKPFPSGGLTMTRNVGRIDQFVRIVLGLALIAYAVKDGIFVAETVAVGIIGLILLLTAFFSSCPLYTLLGVKTCGRAGRTA
jgi:ABC-type uncharacterized transport system permease subunit